MMKCVFVSNILNHHSMYLSEALKISFDEFAFISTQNVENYGYQRAIEKEYVIPYYESERKQEVREIILDADIVIYGACPNELIELRMSENKLSFFYSERFFKKGVWRRFIPRTKKAINNRIIKHKDKNMFVLSASAYLPYDLSLLGFSLDKCYKWGYFPEIQKYDIESLLAKKSNSKVELLWCGRLIDWKHPEVAIKVANKLKKKNISFHMNIIGDGNMKSKIVDLINKCQLNDDVEMLGSKNPSEVRKYMENADIFLATSDYQEGWGAVVNEAMNSGCVVVASYETGSVPYLIKDGENGCIYSINNLKELYLKVFELCNDRDYMRRLSQNAYYSIIDNWNYENAVKKLKMLSESLLNGDKIEIDEGPCSKAPLIK